jgi:GT2 family glycosyltransferase
VVFYPDAQSIHYGGASSAKAPARFYVEKQKANLQYWKKYHRGYDRFAYIATMLLSECLRLGGYSIVWLQPSLRGGAEFKMKRSFACLRWLVVSVLNNEV